MHEFCCLLVPASSSVTDARAPAVAHTVIDAAAMDAEDASAMKPRTILSLACRPRIALGSQCVFCCKRKLSHGGSLAGFRTLYTRLPDQGWAMVMLSNSTSARLPTLEPLLLKLLPISELR